MGWLPPVAPGFSDRLGNRALAGRGFNRSMQHT